MEKSIRQRLQLSVVKFAVKKKNGEVRYATGTTNISLLNEVFNLNIEEIRQVGKEREGAKP